MYCRMIPKHGYIAPYPPFWNNSLDQTSYLHLLSCGEISEPALRLSTYPPLRPFTRRP